MRNAVRITLPPPSPSERAQFELLRLWEHRIGENDEFHPIFRLGSGELSDEEKAENERRAERYRQKRLDIIARYGVADEYLQPLLEEKQGLLEEQLNLQSRLERIEAEIADLQQLQA